MHNDHSKTPVLRYSEEPDRSGKKSGPSAYLRTGVCARGIKGFTLIEVLITVGIITLLIAVAIPAILMSKKRAIDIRVKADLSLIGQALDAYKADFGTYPTFADPATVAAESGNDVWLDQSQYRGAVLLCRTLIGPGPAVAQNKSAVYTPGDDGADGPGFRVRRNYVQDASGNYTIAGKVYGPYIDSSKFKVQYLNDKKLGFAQAYPVLLDINGHPILYYPANPGNPAIAPAYLDPKDYTTSATPPRFNGFDNQGYPIDTSATPPTPLLDSGGAPATDVSTTDFGKLAGQGSSAGSEPYLLWTAGQDGVFGLINGKSDDITNFDLPAQFKK